MDELKNLEAALRIIYKRKLDTCLHCPAAAQFLERVETHLRTRQCVLFHHYFRKESA